MSGMDDPAWDEEPRPPRRMARFSWLAVLFGLVVVFGSIMLPALPFYESMTSNNARLSRFADAVCNHSLPPQTKASGCEREFALLEGNGNHCDYRVRIHLTSAVSKSVLHEYYKDLRFPSPSGLGDIEPVLYREGPPGNGGERKMVLEVSEIAAQAAGFDIRCH